jgi:Ca-activated chloride channel family protein
LNAALLNDLADAGNGIASYVSPGEDTEVKVSNFFRKISYPMLTGCRLEFSGDVRVTDVYPGDLPDVYAGSELVVVGRYKGSGSLVARLLGSRGGETLNHTFETDLNPKRDRYAFIPKLWAGRRIGYLLEDMRKNGETQEVKDEVVRLSKTYGILTPYTAYLAAPEEVRMAAISPPPRNPGMSAQAPILRSQRDMPAISVIRERDLIQMDEATTKRSVTADQIKSLPQTNVADILKSQSGVKIRSDQYHVRGGRASEMLVERDIAAAKLKSAPSTQALGVPTPVPDDEAGSVASGAPTVSVAGKQFTFLDGAWTDWALIGNAGPPADTIAVKPFSEAYFALVKNPEIARFLTVGNPVIFLWRNVVIKIDETGAESWNTAWDKSL